MPSRILVQVAPTRLYRVLLMAANAATAVLFFVDKFGPGIGIPVWDIGMIDAAANGVIVLARQVGDPSTPSLPSPGPVALPTQPTGGVPPGAAPPHA